VEQALAGGHDVVGVSRRVITGRDRLTAVSADIADADAVDAAVAGSDGGAVDAGRAPSRKPISVYSLAARHIVAAMHRHGVKAAGGGQLERD